MQPIAGQFRTVASPHTQQVVAEKRNDPAPSRMGYRFQRVWLTPLYRSIIKTGVPTLLIALALLWYFTRDGKLSQFDAAIAEAKASVQARPEFSVNKLAITGASPALADEIAADLPFEFPFSSFDLDVEIIRAELEDMIAVETAVVWITPEGVLDVSVSEVPAVALWRRADGLFLLSGKGDVLRAVESRKAFADLPLIAGVGAPQRLVEMQAILTEAVVLKGEIRGLVRIGERRWDIILSGGRKIALPESRPVDALRRVLLMAQNQNLLDQDVAVVDFRNIRRPTLRLRGGALQSLEQLTQASIEGIER